MLKSTIEGPIFQLMETIAKEIMSKETLTVTEGASIEEALKLLVNSKITGLPVVDRHGKMIGVLSDYDILSQIAHETNISRDTFKKPMLFSRKLDTVNENEQLDEVTKRFMHNKFRRLPVIDDRGQLVGIITRRDLIRIYFYRAKLS